MIARDNTWNILIKGGLGSITHYFISTVVADTSAEALTKVQINHPQATIIGIAPLGSTMSHAMYGVHSVPVATSLEATAAYLKKITP